MKKYFVLILIVLSLLVAAADSGLIDAPVADGQVAEAYTEAGIIRIASSAWATNDAYLYKQWALPEIGAQEAWKITAGNNDVLVAILDSGINRGHEDLAGKVVNEVNFSDSPVVNDIYGHGTHIAGIIAATANNKLGIAGLAYNCRLLNVKVAGDNGRYTVSALAKGITWAVDNGANVINMSLYSTTPSKELEAAVKYAWSKGVVMVAAAGNSKDIGPVYPAFYENCIPVAATDESGGIAAWSNTGDWVHIAAPGEHIISTVLFGYEYKSGSSMAAAYVSGLAALFIAANRSNVADCLTNSEVKAALEDNCDAMATANHGIRRINVLRTLQSVAVSKKG